MGIYLPPPTINDPSQGGVLVVAGNASSMWLFTEVAKDVGLKYNLAYVDDALPQLVGDLLPSLVVTLGNEAAWTLVADWPSLGKGVEERRGYLWEAKEEYGKVPVLTTVAPEMIAKQWVPWYTLLTFDLEKANGYARAARGTRLLTRPTRTVVIVGDGDVGQLLQESHEAGEVAVDIETIGANGLACVGISVNPSLAYVVGAGHVDRIRRLLEDPFPRKVFQNGAYDTYWLRSRLGIEVGGYTDDTMIAFHCCYPELAGKSETKGSRRTHKSLRFLASLYCGAQEFWKDYAFKNEEERFTLCGIDCCVTLESMHALRKEMSSLNVETIYRHEMRLVKPCTVMLGRGIKVDDELRKRRLSLLDERLDAVKEELNTALMTVMETSPARDKRFLIRDVCKCCRNGSGKREACWGCEGLDKKPTKKMGVTLGPCRKCNGAGAFERVEFNPLSTEQKIEVLYNSLRLPRRVYQGKLSTDEEALKALLSYVST